MSINLLFKTDPRDYALAKIEGGWFTKDQLLIALLKRMSHDDVRDALEANDMHPEWGCEECDEYGFREHDGEVDEEGYFTCQTCLDERENAGDEDEDEDEEEGEEG
jgi:hypothetical protein